MKRTWVQDIISEEAPKLILDMTMRNYGKMPKGSKYTTGEPKNRLSSHRGIYFEDPTANPNKEVVTGVVQVIRYIAEKRHKGISFDGILEAGYRGRAEEAHDWILEFVKDGVLNLKKEYVDEVMNGNYERIWRSTNDWLENFGYEPIEPEAIFPESAEV